MINIKIFLNWIENHDFLFVVGFLLFLSTQFVFCSFPNQVLDKELNQKILFSADYKNYWQPTTKHWYWDGDILVGETTEEDSLTQSSFILWPNKVEDFILNVSFLVSKDGNSGIYYRSELGPEGYDYLLGYQADIDGVNYYTGVVYENFLKRNRRIMAEKGQYILISEEDNVERFPIVFEDENLLKYIWEGEWNDYEIIAKGPLIVQKINGKVMTVVEDMAKNRIQAGWLGFQLHPGPPMKIQFKDGVLKYLNEPK